jgi:hypothetical protein
MGWFDSIKSFGKKAFDTVESLGSKGIGEINAMGQKASAFGHQALKNPMVDAFLLANPELGGLATGALGVLDTGLKASKVGQGLLKQYEDSKPPAKNEPSILKPPPRTGGVNMGGTAKARAEAVQSPFSPFTSTTSGRRSRERRGNLPVNRPEPQMASIADIRNPMMDMRERKPSRRIRF